MTRTPTMLLRPLLDPLALVGRLTAFGVRTVYTLFTTRPLLGETIRHARQTAFESLPVLAAVSVFMGMLITVQAFATFSKFGGEGMIGMFSGMALVRELCPAIAAAIMTAKSGTQIASTIGLMRIKEQIDALEVMAVDPFQFLVVPRLLAMLVVIPCLILYSYVFAFASSYLVGTVQFGLDSGTFLQSALSYVGLRDIGNGMIKGAFFGVIIAVQCSYFGYVADKGPEGVGQATNKAVVFTGIVAIAVNLVLTDMMYG